LCRGSNYRIVAWGYWFLVGLKLTLWGVIISRVLSAISLLAITLFVAGPVGAQSAPLDDGNTPTESSSLFALAAVPSAPAPDIPISSPALYVPPTETQKFRNFVSNALGPVAFAGSSFAAVIDQGFNFPHAWGQGEGAYGARVASNLGISLVTATAQYSMAEAFHEDTAYYRCTCVGFFPRFWHATVSTVAARRGSEGHTSFSIALTASPFIGPLTAANTWIPSRNGPTLGIQMGTYNLLGQFGQNEALEFLYGGPHTLLGRIQRRFFRKSSDSDPKS
jgi:hypothetical protein